MLTWTPRRIGGGGGSIRPVRACGSARPAVSAACPWFLFAAAIIVAVILVAALNRDTKRTTATLATYTSSPLDGGRIAVAVLQAGHRLRCASRLGLFTRGPESVVRLELARGRVTNGGAGTGERCRGFLRRGTGPGDRPDVGGPERVLVPGPVSDLLGLRSAQRSVPAIWVSGRRLALLSVPAPGRSSADGRADRAGMCASTPPKESSGSPGAFFGSGPRWLTEECDAEFGAPRPSPTGPPAHSAR